ncbi:hypothetical protein D5S19_09925 [Amycolatopsis panacis]|uniref:GyrI-like small molecule binding domain-containing protein n=1 Tax=Amycolatopsis panacis TaxID=2340917 RepID=A0A419I6R1_9PSEU|nr:hypothetical protein D5S19_09925 [Amycolatopsis panacis]
MRTGGAQGQPAHGGDEVFVGESAFHGDLPRRVVRWSVRHWQPVAGASRAGIPPGQGLSPSIERLHKSIAAVGCRLVGRHHEIYLGDPRRSAPERLRTILRQPVETA